MTVVEQLKGLLPFLPNKALISDLNEMARLLGEGRTFESPRVAALILGEVKERLEELDRIKASS